MPKLGVAEASGVRVSANTIFLETTKFFRLGGRTRKQ